MSYQKENSTSWVKQFVPFTSAIAATEVRLANQTAPTSRNEMGSTAMPANSICGLPATTKDEMVRLAFRLVDELPKGNFNAVPVDDFCEKWSEDHDMPIEVIHTKLRNLMALILRAISYHEEFCQPKPTAGIA